MESHYHHDGGCRHYHHNHRETYTTSPPCYCIDSTPYCTQSIQQPNSPPPNLNHLLHLITSYLQNQQHRETQCSCETQSPRFNVNQHHQKKNIQREYDNLLRKIYDLDLSLNRQPNSPLNPNHLLHLIASYLQNQQQQRETQSPRFNVNQQHHIQRDYDNLLRKIDNIDLSLNRFSNRRDSYSTLKDSAARVIQMHFRSYLVHRSISFRQLKELETIKSSFLSLKSSVSGKINFPFEAVSREATDLLLQLDSIQGRVDSMIRDGKRSLCRDLVRFLHYIDDCAVKRRNIVSKSAKVVSFKGKDRSFGAKHHTKKPKRQIRTIYVTSNGGEENFAELEEFHFMTDDPIVSKSRLGALGHGDKVKTPITKTEKFGKNRNVDELTSSVDDDDSFDDGEEILMMSRDDGVGCNSRTSAGKSRVIKTVSFDEDGNVYKVYGDTPDASLNGEDDSSTSGSNNEVEDIKYVPKEHEGLEEEEEEEEQVSGNAGDTARNEHQLRKERSVFSPPLPLKMIP